MSEYLYLYLFYSSYSGFFLFLVDHLPVHICKHVSVILCFSVWICISVFVTKSAWVCPLIKESVTLGNREDLCVTLWISMCFFSSSLASPLFFVCLSFCLCICSHHPSPSLVRGELQDPHQTLLFTEPELPGKRAIWQPSGDKRRQKHGYKVLCDLSPTGGARVHTLFRRHKGLAQGSNMAPKGGILSSGERRHVLWGKEASLLHCTGLRGHTPTWKEEEAEVAKKGRVTQDKTIRLEPQNFTLEF